MVAPVFYICKKDGCGTIAQDWFLRKENAEASVPESGSLPLPATIRPLINGEEAFGEVYNRIASAKYSVDIAIWGFQPSMFFKRDGASPCIGDLLVQKAMQGVEVKLLVWSMIGDVQTVMEPNLGNMPNTLGPGRKPGTTDAQMSYDYWWYKMVMGDVFPSSRFDYERTQDEEGLFHQAYNRLARFGHSKNWLNLQVKKRSVAVASRFDIPNSIKKVGKNAMLYMTPSHHQKTVLIDYEHPELAVGFVLEHNMLDNYWDTSGHSVERHAPNRGKNYHGNYQDVSSLVTGQILWNINHNFCQSWDRTMNLMLPIISSFKMHRVYGKSLWRRAGRRQPKENYEPKRDEGTAVFAQILRTYDAPEVQDIEAMYLQNITRVSNYLYTENQYFRWPKLVKTMIKHWKRMKGSDPETHRTPKSPLHWFVITNSTDESLEHGTIDTNEMFELLGRQDVMPGVAKELDKSLDFEQNRQYEEEIKQLNADLERLQRRNITNQKQLDELNEKLELAVQMQKAEERRQIEQAQKLRKDLSREPGLKALIATIVTKESWEEVYIHSKVTIMDDVFLFIGSANINERSMRSDTELGVITQCDALARGLRQQLWAWHTGQGGGEAANPDEMYDGDLERAFKIWEALMLDNRKNKDKDLPPMYPLLNFLRLSPDTGGLD
ncbi:hypothetical protein HYE59_00335 [Aggregatibacter actinomycetemcomitans]|uniref:phospholipase D-like domain-containing protein n=1 Tax=Aggregatibacter actinomycetemcomitans TaxID=714 RepID=UPI00197B81F2|nr:phospholipase D-like domain-containing protein [Aggregatibacter actinomycetemcomitans]MBN6076037.1 hypothetical protein [Aggregatibacter actinomycetemcomitans]